MRCSHGLIELLYSWTICTLGNHEWRACSTENYCVLAWTTVNSNRYIHADVWLIPGIESKSQPNYLESTRDRWCPWLCNLKFWLSKLETVNFRILPLWIWIEGIKLLKIEIFLHVIVMIVCALISKSNQNCEFLNCLTIVNSNFITKKSRKSVNETGVRRQELQMVCDHSTWI